ncbi:MAG: hypothetical protein ACREYF_08900, partial [Gammaproteobacteria bacterium]
HAHRVARAAIGSVPVVGSAAVEAFSALVTPPLEKRRTAWMEAVATELQRLSASRGLSLDDLRTNEDFLDVLFEASQAAIKTSQEEKLAALKNAVLNAAAASSPDESRMKIYVRLVDDLTVWHLRVLTLVNNPTAWFKAQGKPVPEFHLTGSLDALLLKAFPELRDQREFYDYIWKDLYGKGLVGTESLHVMMTPSGVFATRSTELAQGFLQFIQRPEQ